LVALDRKLWVLVFVLAVLVLVLMLWVLDTSLEMMEVMAIMTGTSNKKLS